MKTNLITAIMALGILTPAMAQLKISNDGIAASPKVRQALEARRASAKVAPVLTATGKIPMPCCPASRIAASPKLKEMWPKAASQCCTMDSCMVACSR